MASFAPTDAVALGLLLAFAAWGAWQGLLRLLVAFAVLAAAFPLAGRFGPSVEGAVVKAVSVTESQAERIAWAAVFLGVLLAGGLLFAALRPFLKDLPRPGPGRRLLSALLGLLHGALLISLAVYALLLIAGPGPSSSWRQRLVNSRSAAASRVIARGIRDIVPLPAWLREAAADVDRQIP